MFEGCKRTSKGPQLVSKAAVARHTMPALRMMMQDLLDWAPDSMESPEDIKVCGWVLVLLENLVTFYDCLFDNGRWFSDAASLETHRCLLEVACQHQALTQHFMVN